MLPHYRSLLAQKRLQSPSGKPLPAAPLNNTDLLCKILLLVVNSPLSEARDCGRGSSALVLRSHQFLKAVAKFNSGDKSVFSFLSNCGGRAALRSRVGLLSKEPSPSEVARFLRSSSLLDKKQIGEFLGKNKEFNKAVLDEYVGSFNFYGIDLLSALRMFLESFRLPGESQQIDRIMEVGALGSLDRRPFRSTPICSAQSTRSCTALTSPTASASRSSC